MQLNARDDHHTHRECGDSDDPAEIVWPRSACFGVCPVRRDEETDNEQEQGDRNEWTQADAELATGEANFARR